MAIQVFIPKFRVEECLEQIRICLEKGWTGMGFKTLEFEKNWNEYTGHTYSHFLNSNTSGLHLALNVYRQTEGWQDGDEIITTPITFVSSNHAIMYERFKPVFADVDESLCLDPKSVEERITSKTRAVMYVAMGGHLGQYEKIQEVCKKHKIKLILDAAHLSGARWKGKDPGLEADVSVYSFQAVKNLPTADSGMICFKNQKLDALCRQLSWLGIDKDTFARTNITQGNYKWYYEVDKLGFKYHGNSIMAGIAIVQLKYLDEDNAYRAKLVKRYKENLIRANDKIKIVNLNIPDGVQPAYHLFQVRIPKRDHVLEKLNEKGIFPGVHFRDNTLYSLYSYAQGTCPQAAKASDELLSLPLHLGITEADVDEISKTLIEIVG